MHLPERETFVLSGGTKQDRARALFIALLPPGEECYTAAEVVKPSLSAKADYDLYVAHYRALDSLARVHGFKDGDHPGPDNVIPGTRQRLPGKKKGTLQPCRWKRASWLRIVSDEIYAWLLELNETITEMTAAHPGAERWCDLETFAITAEDFEHDRLEIVAPMTEQAPVVETGEPTLIEESPARFHGRRWGRVLLALAGTAAVLIMVFLFWSEPEPLTNSPELSYDGIPNDAELALDYDEYIKASLAPAPIISTPRPSVDQWARHWQPDTPLMLAATQPPSTLLSDEDVF